LTLEDTKVGVGVEVEVGDSEIFVPFSFLQPGFSSCYNSLISELLRATVAELTSMKISVF
jgi:hypothetical protein